MTARVNLDFISDSQTRNLVKDLVYKIRIFEKSSRPFSSKFLNPAVQKYTKAYLNGFNWPYLFDGANDGCERKVLLLGNLDSRPYSIIYIDNVDESISHRDILGVLISLGIDRDDIGDIVFNQSRVEFALINDSVNDVLYGLNQIKRTPIKAELKDSLDLQSSSREDLVFRGSVASMRLDCIIAEFAKTSRSKSQDLIKLGRVKVNHVEEKRINLSLEKDDIISISGIGRFQISGCEDLSRKNRIFVDYIKKG